MSENETRRWGRVLSPETKGEIFLQVTSREVTQADAARKWQVDVSTIIGIRRAVKVAALGALAPRPEVQHHGEVQPAPVGGDERDVTSPDGVRGAGPEVAMHQIRRRHANPRGGAPQRRCQL